MIEVVFVIVITAIAFIAGRSIRELFKKRPIRQKKARRRGLTKLFAAIALILISLLIITISLVLGVAIFHEHAGWEQLFSYTVIDAFAVYIIILLVNFLKRY